MAKDLKDYYGDLVFCELLHLCGGRIPNDLFVRFSDSSVINFNSKIANVKSMLYNSIKWRQYEC